MLCYTQFSLFDLDCSQFELVSLFVPCLTRCSPNVPPVLHQCSRCSRLIRCSLFNPMFPVWACLPCLTRCSLFDPVSLFDLVFLVWPGVLPGLTQYPLFDPVFLLVPLLDSVLTMCFLFDPMFPIRPSVPFWLGFPCLTWCSPFDPVFAVWPSVSCLTLCSLFDPMFPVWPGVPCLT